jgi:hypothetical protein
MASLAEKDRIFSCEVLVFSSHKTATQTIRSTLNHSDIPTLHGHTLGDIGLKKGEMGSFLKEYLERNGRRLTVISVFREPFERMVSSFFHSLEKYYYARTRWAEFRCDLGFRPDTFERTTEEFSSLLCDYIEKINGFGESIDTLMSELQTSFSANEGHIQANLDIANLFFFRFDQLVTDWGQLHIAANDKIIRLMPTNISANKSYAAVYANFVHNVRLPHSSIEQVYKTRRHLIDLFYPGCYSALLDDAINKYGVK